MPQQINVARSSMPPFEEVAKGHFVACHRVKEIG